MGSVSLYMASLTGVMHKMGLVGGDFRQSVDQNKLARKLLSQHSDISCNLWEVGRLVPQYLLARGAERVKLGEILGGERVVCGIRYVQNGNVERGVYTIIKGLYYLEDHYHGLRELVLHDPSACELFGQDEYDVWIQGYLLSTEGRIHSVVLDVYKQVEVERAGVEELCLD